jgi:hypothetical protein
VKKTLILLASSTLIQLFGRPVEAQTVEDLGGCSQIANFVGAGLVDTSTTRVTAYFLIAQCPAERVTALASGLLATRSGAPESILSQLHGTARLFRDQAIADAALQVANDRSADDGARGYAIRLLLEYLRFNWWPPLEKMASGLDDLGQPRSSCEVEQGSAHRTEQVGDSLAAQFVSSVLTELVRIARDTSEPLFVRNVAACWQGPASAP